VEYFCPCPDYVHFPVTFIKCTYDPVLGRLYGYWRDKKSKKEITDTARQV
jgi:hypothetical protein